MKKYILGGIILCVTLFISQVFAVAGKPTVTFNANPKTITGGLTSKLKWTSSGATACHISTGTGMPMPPFNYVALSGSQIVTPGATTTYQMNCWGSGGTTTKFVPITVL